MKWLCSWDYREDIAKDSIAVLKKDVDLSDTKSTTKWPFYMRDAILNNHMDIIEVLYEKGYIMNPERTFTLPKLWNQVSV